MNLAQQPPLPDTLLRLSTEQSRRLNLSSARSWTNAKEKCLTCSKANNSTYQWYAPGSRNEQHTVRYQCDCVSQYRLYRWMSWAGIGLNYQRADWQDAIGMDDSKAMEAVLDYALNAAYHVNAGNNLILWSKQFGTGKTFLASMLAKRLLFLGVDVYFATLDEILDLYTASWRSETALAHFEERVRTCDVLFMDDIGREHPGRTDVVISMLDGVVRRRVANCLPIAVTTNLQKEELVAYGPNLESLLRERMIMVEVEGVDKRPAMSARAVREHELGLTRPIVIA